MVRSLRVALLLPLLMLQEATCFAPPSLLAPSSPKLTASSPKLTASPRFPRATSHRLCEMSVSEYETLKGLRVKNVKTSEGSDIVSPSGRRLLVFLVSSHEHEKYLRIIQTHFGDLSSWEYARQLLQYMPLLQSRGVRFSGSCPPACQSYACRSQSDGDRHRQSRGWEEVRGSAQVSRGASLLRPRRLLCG